MDELRSEGADLVPRLIDELLRDHDPAITDPSEFWGAQFDRGLAWVQFPRGHGGLGLDPRWQDLVDDRLRSAGAPSPVLTNFMGVGMAAPTLVAFGSQRQKDRYLRPLFTCEEIWCQLFSEPAAGSDLAALSTRAVRDGGAWVVNGQKVWTTLAHVARFGLLLARTDPDVPKHRGLTYFVLDMQTPGVDVRPLRQLTGEAEFNEVFLTDVVIPDSDRIGAVGAGWEVAVTTLMSERVALSGLAKQPRNGGPIRHALEAWVALAPRDPVRCDELVRLWIESELLRLTAVRAQFARNRGNPGPEGAVGKLGVAELHQRIFDLVMALRGAQSLLISNYDMTRPTIMGDDVLGSEAGKDLTKAFLATRGSTIGGGTSEIQRNIIGERILGLPTEPRLDKDLPWRDVPRS